MVLAALSLAVCIIALLTLLKRKPNIYAFHLIERVFGDPPHAADAAEEENEMNGR